MALLFMDSFDAYATADLLEKWTASAAGGTGSAVSIGASSGRRGSQGLRWVTGTGTSSATLGYVTRGAAATGATAIMGFAVSMSGPTGAQGITLCEVRDSVTAQVCLRLNPGGTLSVLRGTQVTGTVLGTSGVALATGTFAYVEWKVLIANAGGTVDVWINGASVLSLTGLDTQNTGAAQWNGVVLGHPGGVSSATTSTSQNVDFDDVYVSDGSGSAPWNTVLGDCRVDVRMPTGAGATTQWTPSAGANWQCVDEIPPNDDTDYVAAATTGLTDTYVVQDAPVAGATIYGVQFNLNMKKTDAGVCTVAPVTRHAGVNYSGAALSPGTAYAYGLQVAATNPGTGVAWVEADFNAAEFGCTRTA